MLILYAVGLQIRQNGKFFLWILSFMSINTIIFNPLELMITSKHSTLNKLIGILQIHNQPAMINTSVIRYVHILTNRILYAKLFIFIY